MDLPRLGSPPCEMKPARGGELYMWADSDAGTIIIGVTGCEEPDRPRYPTVLTREETEQLVRNIGRLQAWLCSAAAIQTAKDILTENTMNHGFCAPNAENLL